MSRSVIGLLILQVVTALAVAFGFVEREAAFFVTAILMLFTALRPLEEGAALFLLSIPFFFALPFSESFDSMSSWRILLAILFIKYVIDELQNSPSVSFRPPSRNPDSSVSEISWTPDQVRGDKESRFVFQSVLRSRLFWLASAFLGWGLISALVAPYPIVGIKKVLFLLNIFLLFPVMRFVVQRVGHRKMLHVTCYMLHVVLAVGFLQLTSLFFVPLEQFWRFWAGNVIPVFYGYHLGELLQTSNTWFSFSGGSPTLRMFSVFPDSHSFAMFAMLGISVPVSIWIVRKQTKMLIPVIVTLFAIVLSGSRGVWLSAGAVALLLIGIFWFIKRGVIDEALQTIIKRILLVFIIFAVLFIPATFVSSLAQRAQGGDADTLTSFKRLKSITDLDEVSNKSRLQIWSIGLKTILERPVFGVGPGNFSVALGETIGSAKRGASAHNLYLDIAAEMGVPGLVTFLALIGWLLWDLLRAKKVLIPERSEAESKGFRWTFARPSTGSGTNFSSHRIATGSMVFLVYFTWVLLYSFFDVVLFNDKVLLMATALLAMYGSSTRNSNTSSQRKREVGT